MEHELQDHRERLQNLTNIVSANNPFVESAANDARASLARVRYSMPNVSVSLFSQVDEMSSIVKKNGEDSDVIRKNVYSVLCRVPNPPGGFAFHYKERFHTTFQ